MPNLKLAFRTLFKSPFVSSVALLSLALGIGANAAIFSMFNQMLLRPLPVSHPERLVNLAAPGPKDGNDACNATGNCNEVFSYPMYLDLARARRGFARIAAHRFAGVNLAYHNQSVTGNSVLVSGSYFPILGLTPALGRLLGPADDQAIGAHAVAVLSHRYWETRLGADPAVLNTTLSINGRSFTIVGVAPRGFEGTTLGQQALVFVPITMRQVLSPTFNGFEDRRSYWVYLFARLAPGASIDQATAAINAAYRPIVHDIEAPVQSEMSPATRTRFLAKVITVVDGRRGQSQMHGETRTPLRLLFAITGVVLLIACANIANLLLARGANRSMEMAVRLSLGATRRQLLVQLLTESCLLAVLGGAVGLGVAYTTLTLISAILPVRTAAALHFSLDLPALLFAGGLSLVTGLLFGLFPALHSTRPDLVTTLRDNSTKTSGTRTAARFRSSLVTVQIALSMALLISAGLFIKSLRNVSRVDLGVQVDHLLTFGIAPALNGYDPARSRVLFARTTEELAALPGVTGVSSATIPILANSTSGGGVNVQGFQKTLDTDDNARYNRVGPDFFSVVGIPLLAGREFTLSDVSPGSKVAIVNEAFLKKFHLGRDVVGKRFGEGSKASLDVEIVGLVRDAKNHSVKDAVPAQYFRPHRQDDRAGVMTYYLRTSGDPEMLLRTIPGVIARLDPTLPVDNLRTMPVTVRENVYLDRMISMLSVAFAALATLLAAVGLYGVLAYSVAQRTREIGVRMALGADSRRVLGMVLRQVGVMTAVGGVVGIAGALALGRGASSLLYGMEGKDPVVVAAAAAVLALVAFGAGYVPALRAARTDPMQALRYE